MSRRRSQKLRSGQNNGHPDKDALPNAIISHYHSYIVIVFLLFDSTQSEYKFLCIYAKIAFVSIVFMYYLNNSLFSTNGWVQYNCLLANELNICRKTLHWFPTFSVEECLICPLVALSLWAVNRFHLFLLLFSLILVSSSETLTTKTTTYRRLNYL